MGVSITNATASSLFPAIMPPGGPQTRPPPPVNKVQTPPLTP